MSGKGSRPRPFSVDQKTFDNNWDAIFKKQQPEFQQQPPKEKHDEKPKQ
jgi:hypothetical protein